MNITLYANCIVNPNYDEVFSKASLFEGYLNTLDSYSMQIPYMYITYSGTLQFEYSNNFFPTITTERSIMQCSYLKIESTADEEPTKVYAFINHIELINGICILSYTTDIWHSYFDKWNFRNGLLSRTLQLDYYNIKEKEYPFTIFGTNNVNIKNIKNNNNELLDKCYILCTLQLYKLQSGTDTKVNRILRSYILQYREDFNGYSLFNFALGSSVNGEYTKYNPLTTLDKAIEQLIIGQSRVNKVKLDDSTETQDMYYDITNVYLLPKDTIQLGSGYQYTDGSFIIASDTKNNQTLNAKPIDLGDNLIYSSEITCDYKNLSIGCFTNKVELQNNGLNEIAKIKCTVRNDNIYFYLLLDNRIIDITENFRYDLPWQGVTADTLVQRSISTQLQNMTLENSRTKIGIGIAKNSVNAISSFGQAGLAASPTKIIGNITGAINNALYVGSGVADLELNSEQEKANDAEKYSNSKANECVSQAVINALYGICLFSVNDEENYSNYQETQYKLQQVGYKVSHFTDKIDLEHIGRTNPYDIIKFDFVRISGLPTDLNNAIKQILLNGTKIWYTSNV